MRGMIIENDFDFGEIVYLKTDLEQHPRILTKISICPDKTPIYHLTSGTIESGHFSLEISREINHHIESKVT